MHFTSNDYTTARRIYDGMNSHVYLLKKGPDNQPLVLKVLKTPDPSPEQIVRFDNEYELTRGLDIQGVRKALWKGTIEDRYALALEYVPGEMLKDSCVTRRRTLSEMLRVASSLAATLGQIHQHQIVHKDINSHNILIYPENLATTIIDFGIASKVHIKTFHLGNPATLEGTLHYISPEQTGRMNRVVDYRSDLYSLGVTLYEMFSGELPFTTTDALELVHCHIAKLPVPPCEVNPEIPKIVSDIIMKLLCKDAEERYQSAYGLHTDLGKCLEAFSSSDAATGRVALEPFVLAQKDRALYFQIPQKLYGRERETKELLGAYERVSQQGNPELLLLEGAAGAGKTALVDEAHHTVTAKQSYFISGKFARMQRHVPYSAFRQAFAQLAEYILTENDARLTEWKQHTLKAVGNNAQVILDLIPALEPFLGKQPPLLEVAQQDAENRFKMTVRNFVNVIACEEHPLVLFLDNIQWADSASLQLLKIILSDSELRYCLVIAACRRYETDASHPFQILVNELRQSSLAVTNICVEDLTASTVNALLADALNCDPAYSQPLADIMQQKTHGNAFFVTQFLRHVHEKGLLRFEAAHQRWSFDAARIRDVNVTENVIEFMEQNIQKQSAATQYVLGLAACIGNRFDLSLLAHLYERSPRETLQQLWPALHEGLVVPASEHYKYFNIDEEPQGESLSAKEVLFTFLHDRVRQTAYSLAPQEARHPVHLKIGRELLAEHAEAEVFTLVNHLNLAGELLVEDSEKLRLAELNLRAGRQAKSASAYEHAYDYFLSGKTVLERDDRQRHDELLLELSLEAADAAMLSGQFAAMGAFIQEILQQHDLLAVRARVYEIKIQAYMAQNALHEAIHTALEILASFGVEFPEQPTPQDIGERFGETASALAEKTMQMLLEAPLMDDPDRLASLRILTKVMPATFYVRPDLLPLVVFQQVLLSVRYGSSPMATFAYANYGLILCGVIGDLEKGYEFGQLALRLLERFSNKEAAARTIFTVNCTIVHWKRHVAETLAPFKEAYNSGLETGDLEFATLSSFLYCFSAFFAGRDLFSLEREMKTYDNAMKRLNQQAARRQHRIYFQTLLNLRGKSQSPLRLIGDMYDEEAMLPQLLETHDNTALCHLYCTKLILCYIFQEFAQALEQAEQAERYLDGLTGTLTIVEFYFYDSLTRLAMYQQLPPSKRQNALEKVAENQQKMKVWAEKAPMNHLHKYTLIEAETLRCRGKLWEATLLYDRAALEARRQQYIHEEALAYEIAARCYQAYNLEIFARACLREAYRCYQAWGARAKARQLEERYRHYLEGAREREYTQSLSTLKPGRLSTTSTSMSSLDMATIMKAAQTLSEEVELQQLLEKVMRLVIENAGATKGLLLLKDDDGDGTLLVQAQGSVDDEEIETMQAVTLDESRELPVSLVQYAARNLQPLVVNNVAHHDISAKDEYICRTKPASLLCLPVIHQNNLRGVLYLENRLSAGVFTLERLELLSILASQAAISIDITRHIERVGEQKRLQREIELARQIQTAILPKEIEHPDFEIAAAMLPAEEVGGDYYDVLTGKDGSLWLAIGDVSGHGVTPGLVMMMAQTIHATLATHLELEPQELHVMLNASLYENVSVRLQANHFMTFTTLKYQGNGHFDFAGAHLDIIVHRKASGDCEMIDTPGVFLNFLPDISHAAEQASLTMEIGDTMVLYTDGLTEAQTPDGKILDVPRFMEIVRHHAAKTPTAMRDAILEEVLAWSEQHREDDMTLLIVRRTC